MTLCSTAYGILDFVVVFSMQFGYELHITKIVFEGTLFLALFVRALSYSIN